MLTLMVTARTYPLQDYGVFVKAGWGYAKHRYWETSASKDASGAAYLIGLGYDIYISSFFLSYSSGDLDQESYKAVTVTFGFTF